jgi:methylmalonyl-CoA/ethylmalonyl-CoA epimerase
MTEVTDGIGVSRIGQIAMTVGDLPRAIAFYRDVLGLRFLFEAPPAMAFFDCGGVRLMLSLPEEKGDAAGQRFASIIYYAVPDIQEAAAVLVGRGVQFEAAPHVVARLPHADLWMGFLRDPDGNLLAIMSEVAGGVGSLKSEV